MKVLKTTSSVTGQETPHIRDVNDRVPWWRTWWSVSDPQQLRLWCRLHKPWWNHNLQWCNFMVPVRLALTIILVWQLVNCSVPTSFHLVRSHSFPFQQIFFSVNYSFMHNYPCVLFIKWLFPWWQPGASPRTELHSSSLNAWHDEFGVNKIKHIRTHVTTRGKTGEKNTCTAPTLAISHQWETGLFWDVKIMMAPICSLLCQIQLFTSSVVWLMSAPSSARAPS